MRASPDDAAELADVSRRAFHSDIECGAPGLGGPPGYDRADWQANMMEVAEHYAVFARGEIVGGCIVFRMAIDHCELGRIFIDPHRQNGGIGAAAMAALFREYPSATRWTLGTPGWNARTLHFYRKLGFVETGHDEHGGVLFERRAPA